jgi:hypothetical protein
MRGCSTRVRESTPVQGSKAIMQHKHKHKGRVTDNEFRSFVDSCLKANKSPGPDGYMNECVKTMSPRRPAASPAASPRPRRQPRRLGRVAASPVAKAASPCRRQGHVAAPPAVAKAVASQLRGVRHSANQVSLPAATTLLPDAPASQQ